MPWKSTTIAGSFPTVQASCPDGSNETSPGLHSNSLPSSMRTINTPEMWYWKCGASQLFVLAKGWTEVAHLQPGSKMPRPTVAPPTLISSRRPFGNSRTSSGFPKLFNSALFMFQLLLNKIELLGHRILSKYTFHASACHRGNHGDCLAGSTDVLCLNQKSGLMVSSDRSP